MTGNASTLSWIDHNPNGGSIFIDDTHILHYHSSINDILLSDVETQTTEVFYDIKGYSNAFALNPLDEIFIAFGDDQSDGKTDLYKVIGDDLEYILSFPYGYEKAMAFDQNGMGYIALSDINKGGAIYQFDPTNQNFEEYHKTKCVPSVIGYHPSTNQIWWDDCGDFFSKSKEGDIQSFSGVDNISYYSGLVITNDNEFYTVGFHPVPDNQTPNPRFLYKYDTTMGEWSQVIDLTQRTALVPLATVTACQNGNIFIIQGVDQTWLPVSRNSLNAVFRLEEGGSLNLLAYDVSHDTNAAACDSENNLIFPSGGGIFMLSLP